MNSPTRAMVPFFLAALPALGCGKSEPAAEKGAALTPTATVQPSAKPPAASAAPAVATAATASASAAAGASAAPGGSAADGPSNKRGVFTNIPKTASKVPTVAEWAAAPEIKDINTIESMTNFEIKNVREWVKVTMKTYMAPGAGGTTTPLGPSAVVVRKGKDGNVFEFTAKDESLTSVVFPLVEGKEREFFFEYALSGTKLVLSATWAKGTPEAKLSFRKGP